MPRCQAFTRQSSVSSMGFLKPLLSRRINPVGRESNPYDRKKSEDYYPAMTRWVNRLRRFWHLATAVHGVSPRTSFQETVALIRALAGMQNPGWHDNILSRSPHFPGMYGLILEHWLGSARVHFLTAGALHRKDYRRDMVNVVLRHDLDSFPERVDLFTNVEESMDLVSSIFVRLDNQAYRPAVVEYKIKRLYESGFEIGLHSSAYLHEYALGAFEEELRDFRRTFGFSPSVVNTHGIPTNKRRVCENRRRAFLAKLTEQEGRFAVALVDHIVPGEYDVSIGDAHFALNRRLNFLARDVLTVSDHPAGYRVLFMTHPEYW